MIAKIRFTIYGNYYEHITPSSGEYENDYSHALKFLNAELKELVAKNKLTFLYKNRRVKIILPVEMTDTGNIFDGNDCIYPQWEGVEISCEIDCKPEEFDSSRLNVSKCPNFMCAHCVIK